MEYKCGICGKTLGSLYDFDEYVYRRGKKFFCSYKCMRQYDLKERERKMKEWIG